VFRVHRSPVWLVGLVLKGYETEKDRAKWSQFPHEIKIIRKKEIKQIERGQIIEL